MLVKRIAACTIYLQPFTSYSSNVSCFLTIIKTSSLSCYLSYCYTIAWDRLSNKFFLSVYVCVYVCVCGHAYGRIFQPIFTKFGKNLWGLNRKNWLGWGRNPKIPSPILAPKTKILWAWIGISSQICKNFKSSYLQNYIYGISIKFDRPMWPNEKTWWVVRYDDVTNPRWRTAAILDFDFGP